MAQQIKTVLNVDASRAVAGFAGAERAAAGYERAVQGVGTRTNAAAGFARLSTSIRENRAAWDDLSSKAMIGGTAIAGGMGLAAKAAVDWESAWAGVQKTTDGTDAQMAQLEGELRGLAKTLPATHEEIAGVAEAAGQLGIERGNVTSFTKTMIDMGESTNLSAEEAATSIARFSNVMGTAQSDASKIGSAVVELGNNFATTEGEIMAMSLRLSGAGSQANMTEGDVLGIATAMSSVGIEAEAGGTAMSRVIIEMGKSVDMGNDKLEVFARTAGMSTEAFAKLWNENSGEAMQRFIAGLGQMQARGESLEPTLAELGMTDIRVGDALRRSANAADLFTRAMETGNTAYAANKALAKEAQQRYETDASRIRIAANQIRDAMISFGADIAPVVANVVEGIADIADWFGRLPGPVRTFITSLTGITGATLLLGGAAIKAVGFAQDLSGTLGQVTGAAGKTEQSVGRANRAVAGVGRWSGYALGAAALVTALNQIEDAATATPASVEEVTSAILDLDRAGSEVTGLENVNKIFTDLDDQSNLQRMLMDTSVGVDGLADAYRRLNDPTALESTNNVIDSMQGWIGMTGDVEKLEGVFKTFGESLAEMPADEAAAQFDLMVQAIGGGEETAKRLLELMPAYRDQLKGAENDARMAGDGASKMGGDLDGMGDAADDAASATEKLTDSITELGDELLAAEAGEDAYRQALADANSALQENGATLNANTERGRANRAALRDIVEETQAWAAAKLEETGSVAEANKVLSAGRKNYIDMRMAMGDSRKEATALADQLFEIPDDVTTEFTAKGLDAVAGQAMQAGAALGLLGADASGAKSNVLDLDTSIKTLNGKTVTVKEAGANASQVRVRELDGTLVGLPSSKKVQVTEIGSTAAGEMVVQFKDKVFAIPASRTAQIRQQGSAAAKAQVMGLNESIRLLNGKTVKVGEDGAQNATGRVRTMDGAIFGLRGKTVKVEEIGATPSGDRVVSLDGKIYRLSGKTVDVGANVFGGAEVGALIGQIGQVRSKTVTIRAHAAGAGLGVLAGSFADGGFYAPERYADGGVRSIGSQQPQIQPAGGKGILWAEEGAGPWEAFISGHPAKRERSKAIWMETGKQLGMIEAFASGGVYGDWQKWLRYTRRLAAQGRYKYEDGSSKIRIFEDGTAQWRGYGAADGRAARAIRNLNRAQDRYEDALNAKERRAARSSSSSTWQHSDYYKRKQAEWAAIRRQGSGSSGWQHSDYYLRKQAEWAAIRRERAAQPKSWAGHAFQRSTPAPHASRAYREPSGFRTVATGGQSTVTRVDSKAIGSAVASAVSAEMKQMQVVTKINGRDFHGVMQKTTRDRTGR